MIGCSVNVHYYLSIYKTEMSVCPSRLEGGWQERWGGWTGRKGQWGGG